MGKVILFSLGVTFHSQNIPEERVQSLIAAFANLKEKVIFKFDSPVNNVPKNMIVLRKIPQQDILNHGNVR